MSLTVQDTKQDRQQDRQLTDMDLLEFERGVGFEAPDFIIAAAQKDNADDIRLTDSQQVIHDALVDFALYPGDRWYIAMSGYAGTGKTTVISKAAQRILDEEPERRILFCAPTGKAAQVMKSKLTFLRHGCTVGTIHSAIYTIDTTKKNGPREELVFKKKSQKVLPYDLIIVDEASMLTEKVFNDLLSYSIPVIFVGDPGQLPPVEGKPVDILHTTPFVLTEVMRQALENPIVQWATDVRGGGALPWTPVPWSEDEKCIRIRMSSAAGRGMLRGFADDAVSGKAAILCCKNSLRVKLNGLVRAATGFSGKLPVVGERLMCLRNMKGFGLYNGNTYTVSRIEECANDACYKVWLDDREYPVIAWAGCLNCADGVEMGRRLKINSADIRVCMFEETCAQEEAAMFDFGYASTVHKAQGSEWDSVLFYDDHSLKMSEAEYSRWLYTGITRAKNELCILA